MGGGGRGGRGGRRGSRKRPQQPGALSTCYLATQKASGRIPFGTPGKAFNFISRHVNIPECPIGGTLFCTEQYKYPIFYSTGALSFPNSFSPLPLSFILTPYTPPLIKKKKKTTDVYFIDITYTMVRPRIICFN